MSTGLLVSNVGASLTLGLGLLAIVYPKLVGSLLSISAEGKEGVSEIRATYGGFFIGISVFTIVVQSTEVFLMLGIGWLAASFVRLFTVLFSAWSVKNIGGVIVEGAIGGLCISSAIT
jgi:hypothetical protein